jgi:beta-xylosidase
VIQMAYVYPNYKSKKEFKEAVLRGVQHQTYNPSGMFPTTQDGEDVIEGPHYPQPHGWYARVLVEKGIVVKVLG